VQGADILRASDSSIYALVRQRNATHSRWACDATVANLLNVHH